MAPFRSRRLSTQIQVIRAVPRVQQVALFGLWDSQTTGLFFLGILCRFPSTSNMKVLIRPRGWVAAGRLSGVSKKTATDGNCWADSISISFWWGGFFEDVFSFLGEQPLLVYIELSEVADGSRKRTRFLCASSPPPLLFSNPDENPNPLSVTSFGTMGDSRIGYRDRGNSSAVPTGPQG